MPDADGIAPTCNASPKRTLSLADYGVLALIFFGYFIFISLWTFFGTPDPQTPSAASFSDEQNIFSIILELALLSLAALYLWWRKFDFASLSFSVGWQTLPIMLALILLGGGVIDLFIYGSYWLHYGVSPMAYFSAWDSTAASNLFGYINAWLLLFALLNGFFEEFFFMGLTFAVNAKHQIIAIIASVFIRFSFHLYQGLASALGIACMGLLFILVRRKFTSLVPFILVHALFDIFGAGVFFWLYMAFQ